MVVSAKVLPVVVVSVVGQNGVDFAVFQFLPLIGVGIVDLAVLGDSLATTPAATDGEDAAIGKCDLALITTTRGHVTCTYPGIGVDITDTGSRITVASGDDGEAIGI